MDVQVGSLWTFYLPLCKEMSGNEQYIISARPSKKALPQENTNLFMIKKISIPNGSVTKFKKIVHTHILDFDEVYLSEGSYFLVYRHVDVSILDAIAGPYGIFEEHHMATMYQGVSAFSEFYRSNTAVD